MVRNKRLLGLGVAAVILVGGGFVFWTTVGRSLTIDPLHPAQFIEADFIELGLIGQVSKFRSGAGHDFSGGGETCRNMKHYFTPITRLEQMDQAIVGDQAIPPPPTAQTEIAIYSPVDGKVVRIEPEQTPIGEQIFIVPKKAPGYTIRLFHIYRSPNIKVGTTVSARQRLGRISKFSGTDIAVEIGGFKRTYVSYFDVMPDAVFAAYQQRGVQQRSDLIFTREFRDAHPLDCQGEQFINPTDGPNSDQVVTLNGWSNSLQPSGDQSDRVTNASESI